MKYNQETTADDLLMLPDIDGIVKDIKNQETVSSATEEMKEKDIPKGKIPEQPLSGSWKAFIKCSEQYDYRVKMDDRKVCHIDLEIHETLKMCDINKMSLTTLINAILRAFIMENADELRRHMTRKKTLI